VADRIAQTVAALTLEPRTESIFHDDSYGYRPGRSPLMAVAKCRRRCWARAWVVDLDVAKFFDSVNHGLMVKAVQANITPEQKWVMLYVKRWLTAPIRMPDGRVVERDRGTPQGSAVSPVLANLFMHYAFDSWLEREFPTVEFERFADDAVVHCFTQRQAHQVRDALAQRLQQVGLQLHPDKTKIVYCRDRRRRLAHADTGRLPGNAASLNALSLLTWGREWLRVTSRSTRSWATDLLVIEVPRSACTTLGLP
jgi:RNA-directed DNA polymerase